MIATEHFAFAAIKPSVRQCMPRVVTDYMDAIRQAWRRAVAWPGVRLGLMLNRNIAERTGYRWVAGYLLMKHLEPGVPAAAPFVYEDGDRAAVQAWRREQRPTVVFGTEAAMKDLADSDVKFVVLAQQRGETHCGMVEPAEEIGRAVCDLVIGQLNRSETGPYANPKTVLLRARWQEAAEFMPLPTRKKTV